MGGWLVKCGALLLAIKPVVEGTGIRLVGRPTPSMWRVWLGIHISHGLGVFTFGLLCLLNFWFYGPVIITGTATACFTVATVLSA